MSEMEEAILTKIQIASMNSDDRYILLSVGHIINQLNIFSRLLLMTRNSKSDFEPESHMYLSQSLCLIRMLNGHLKEAKDWLRKDIVSKKINHYESLRKSLELLKSDSGFLLIDKIRNKISFHIPDQNTFDSAFNISSENDRYSILSGNTRINGHFHMSDIVMTHIMVTASGLGALDDMDEILDAIIGIHGKMNDFLHEFASLIIMDLGIMPTKIIRWTFPEGRPTLSQATLPMLTAKI